MLSMLGNINLVFVIGCVLYYFGGVTLLQAFWPSDSAAFNETYAPIR